MSRNVPEFPTSQWKASSMGSADSSHNMQLYNGLQGQKNISRVWMSQNVPKCPTFQESGRVMSQKITKCHTQARFGRERSNRKHLLVIVLWRQCHKKSRIVTLSRIPSELAGVGIPTMSHDDPIRLQNVTKGYGRLHFAAQRRCRQAGCGTKNSRSCRGHDHHGWPQESVRDGAR